MSSIKKVLHTDWYSFYIKRYNNPRVELVGYYLHICTPNRGCFEAKVLELGYASEPRRYVQSATGRIWAF